MLLSGLLMYVVLTTGIVHQLVWLARSGDKNVVRYNPVNTPGIEGQRPDEACCLVGATP